MISGEQSESDYPERGGAPAAATFAGAGTGPTVLRIYLGGTLRRHREAAGLTMDQAAEAIRGTHSKVSRMERGRVGFKQRDVADLLALYGVADAAERERLLALAREASAPGWWQQYADILPHWFELYLGLERAASEIRGFELQFVHGLLQTEDYARAVIRIGNANAPAEEIERRVSLRMERQRLLTQPDPPKLWAVLDELALRRAPDGRNVMRAQLEHLLTVTDLPRVSLQIVPFDKGPHSGAGGAFSILRFPDTNVPDVVYMEHLNSAVYLDHREAVDEHRTVMDKLATEAATPAASRDMIVAALREA